MAAQAEKRAAEAKAASTTNAISDAPTTAPAADVKIETRADGTRVVEGRFPIKGDGSRESPYILSWDYLLSAQDDFSPKDGKKEIPARIRMLDGKWVAMTGYVAFPLMVSDADELLSMMNQWDGCCIGIPPTPYDAIEVKLATPVTGRDRLTTFGSVTGRLRVDPHLIGGWLVGLYIMDQATLKSETYGGFHP